MPVTGSASCFPSGFLALLFRSYTQSSGIWEQRSRWRQSHGKCNRWKLCLQRVASQIDNRQTGSSRLTLLNMRNSAKSRQLLWQHREGRGWTASVYMGRVGWGRGFFDGNRWGDIWVRAKVPLMDIGMWGLWRNLALKVTGQEWSKQEGEREKQRREPGRACQKMQGLDGDRVVHVFKDLGEV